MALSTLETICKESMISENHIIQQPFSLYSTNPKQKDHDSNHLYTGSSDYIDCCYETANSGNLVQCLLESEQL